MHANIRLTCHASGRWEGHTSTRHSDSTPKFPDGTALKAPKTLNSLLNLTP